MEWSNDSSIPALAQSVPLRNNSRPGAVRAAAYFHSNQISAHFLPPHWTPVVLVPFLFNTPSLACTIQCQEKSPPLWLRRDDDHSGRPSAMPTMSRECEAISKELQDRYELDDELDLKEIAPLMLQLREALPPASFKFLLTLCESVFSKLDPDLVQVPVMKKKLEAALAAQAKTLGRRGGEDAATEPPDRL